jgi:hypothetical protein
MRALQLFVALAIACSQGPLAGYRAASAEELAGIRAAVSEYFELYDRAIATHDVTALHQRYPRLAEGTVRERGVNIEVFAVRNTDPRLREARTEVEWYETVRAWVKDDRAVAYARGLFTWTYSDGNETKGEHRKRFDLSRTATGWSIERTDEWILGEGPPEPTPR